MPSRLHSEVVLRQLVAPIESSGPAIVVGTSDDAIVAVEEILQLTPNLVLVDFHLRVGSGLDIIGRLQSARCPAMQIVLTKHFLPVSDARRQQRGPTISLTRRANLRSPLLRSIGLPGNGSLIFSLATERAPEELAWDGDS
ncbi:hypothetical protein [Paraburkholderia unamae]|uniref:hypothetical protein n=1 Tax=Paraburkholderia unamae TaxID=219649 RepID=UPI001C657869|nr:hypothetical protein [Paraburkholderia unamae]